MEGGVGRCGVSSHFPQDVGEARRVWYESELVRRDHPRRLLRNPQKLERWDVPAASTCRRYRDRQKHFDCPLSLPDVRSQTIILGRTDIRANSARVRRTFFFQPTGCERTSRKFVLLNSGAARQQWTFVIINSEAGGHSEKCMILHHVVTRYTDTYRYAHR